MGRRLSCYACILCVSHAGLLAAAPAEAAEGWGGSIALASDYIYRGISQTRGQAAAQSGIELRTPSGWSAGVWGSSVDFYRGTGITYEIDLHAAYAWSIANDWSAQLGLVHYEYPSDGWLRYDYDELTAALSYQQRLTASVAWSPNASRYAGGSFVRDRPAVAYELALLQPLQGRWSLSAGLGHYDLRELFGAGYWYWNAGLVFSWDALQVDLQHIDTDQTAERLFGARVSGGRWAAVLTWRF